VARSANFEFTRDEKIKIRRDTQLGLRKENLTVT